jgi:hypothetical protein
MSENERDLGEYEFDVNELINIYLTIRTERERLEAEWKARDDELRSDMKVFELKLLTICNETKASSIKTPNGTVIRKLNERFTVASPEVFRKFVMEEGAIELFESRIHQGNFKEFMASREGNMPPGVNVMREFNVVVRKPSQSI